MDDTSNESHERQQSATDEEISLDATRDVEADLPEEMMSNVKKPLPKLAQAYLDATRRASKSVGLGAEMWGDSTALPGTVQTVVETIEGRNQPTLAIHNKSAGPMGSVALPARGTSARDENAEESASDSSEGAGAGGGDSGPRDGTVGADGRAQQQQQQSPVKKEVLQMPKLNVTAKDPRLQRMASDVARYLKVDSDTAVRLSLVYLCTKQSVFVGMLEALSLLRNGVNVTYSYAGGHRKQAILTLTQGDPLAVELKSGRIFSSVRTIAIPRFTALKAIDEMVVIEVDCQELQIKFKDVAAASKVLKILELILGRGSTLYNLNARKSDGQVFYFE